MVLWQLLMGEPPYSDFHAPHVIVGLMTGNLRPEWPEKSRMPELVEVSGPCALHM